MWLDGRGIFNDGSFAYSVHCLDLRRPWSFAEHGHRGFCDLLFVESGTVQQRVNGQESTMTAGDLMLVREGDRHALWGSRFRYHNVNVPMAEWSRLVAYLGVDLPLAELWSAPVPPRTSLDRAQARRLGADMRRLFDRQTDPHARPELVRVLVEWLAVLAIKRPAGAADGPPRPAWLDGLLPIIDAGLEQGLQVTDLPRRAGVSQAHVSRTLRRHLGVSPSQYLNQRRLARAALLLARTQRDVTDIALSLGFRSPGYFFRLFRQAYQVTPAAWRRQEAGS